VDSNLTYKKCWQSVEVTGVCADGTAGNRLIMVHVGSSAGFLKYAELVYKAGTATGDYHRQMNSSSFEKWVRDKLLLTFACQLGGSPRQFSLPQCASRQGANKVLCEE
jgi:hypothetical protein